MIRKLLMPVVCAAISSSSFAQSTLTAANFNPVVGDAFAIKVYNGSSVISPGASGPNVVWDFSSSFSTSTADTGRAKGCFEVTPGCASFPGSNLIIIGPSVTVHGRSYLATSSTKLSQVGAYVSADTNLKLTDPLEQLRFPFTYPDSYTDPFSGILTMGAGIDATHAGTVTVTCDGHGILKLPGRNDTGVLRVHSVQTFTDSVNAFGYPLVTYEIHSYDWYKPNYHTALLTIQRLVSLTLPLPDQHFVAFAAAKVTAVNEVSSKFSELELFPNPTSGTLNIKFSTALQEQVKVSLLDILGKEIAVVSDKKSNGVQQLSVDAGKYPAGIYLVRLQAGAETVIRKITIE